MYNTKRPESRFSDGSVCMDLWHRDALFEYAFDHVRVIWTRRVHYRRPRATQVQQQFRTQRWFSDLVTKGNNSSVLHKKDNGGSSPAGHVLLFSEFQNPLVALFLPRAPNLYKRLLGLSATLPLHPYSHSHLHL